MASLKVLIFILVGTGNIVDKQLIGSGSVLGQLSSSLSLQWGISIIENAGILGLPIPQKLKDVLAQLKGKGDD